ncbi:MAG: HugZ family protein [Planctomycetaceae bacterium]
MSASHALLKTLVTQVSNAALGTWDGETPFVSMTPFAVAADGRSLFVHVSRLAAHTRHMLAHPAVSLLVMEPEAPGKMPQGLARVTIQGRARTLSPQDPAHAAAKNCYLTKFPSAAELFHFADFELVQIEVLSARLVGGFAQASSLSADTFARAVAT